MSFFHKMKKAVVGTKQEAGTASICPDYDAVRVDFESLHDVMLRIRQHLLTYREANSRMWTSATSLSTEFANMLEPAAGDDHPYTAMASTMKASHSQLPAEREKLDTMLNACLFPLKEQLAKYEELKVRMAEHDKQKDEVIYYQGKVSSLRTSREQSKKAESQADKDKYERNMKKMMDQEVAFHQMDMELTAELRYAFEHRVAVLGPIMLAFVCAEREIANRYTQAINEVQLVDVNEANTWLAKHEAAMAAKASQGQTVTSTTTVVSESPNVTVKMKKTKKIKATTAAPGVAVFPDESGFPDTSGATLATVSTTGVVISEPHFAGTNGTASAATADPFAAPNLRSPRSPNAFDNFEPAFSSAPSAFDDPFYSAINTTQPATTTQSATTAAAAVDGVPYTIGSTATHTAPAVTSTTATTTEPTTVNGTSSTFPVESSTSASTTTTDIAAPVVEPPVVAAPAVAMDDMTLEKTRGAEQLDAQHGSVAVVGDVVKSEKTDVDAAEPYVGTGVGEKTDMFAPTTESPAIV